MIQATRTVFDYVSSYYSSIFFSIAFLSAFIYLFLFEKKLRKPLLYPSLVIALIVINPVLYKYLYEKVLEYAYWRALWLIPVIPVAAAACSSIIHKCSGQLAKSAVLLLISLVVILNGHNLYTAQPSAYHYYRKAENPYKLSSYVINVSEALRKLSDTPRALVDSSLVSTIRQYAGDIQIMYGETSSEGNYCGHLNPVLSHLESDFPNYLYVHKAMKLHGFEYLVSLEGKATEEEMRQCGFIKRDSVDGYGIYELDQQADFSQSGWQLSRHTSLYDESIAYYTLANASGDHVVIDSSTPQEAYYFGMMLDQYPDGLTAWIITDPSAAQNSTLQWIVENGFNVKIDQAYKHGTNSFDALLEQHSSLTHLSAGDEVSVGDLTLRVLSIDEISGFMEFELCGQKNSVRFTRDSMPEGITVIQ